MTGVESLVERHRNERRQKKEIQLSSTKALFLLLLSYFFRQHCFCKISFVCPRVLHSHRTENTHHTNSTHIIIIAMQAMTMLRIMQEGFNWDWRIQVVERKFCPHWNQYDSDKWMCGCECGASMTLSVLSRVGDQHNLSVADIWNDRRRWRRWQN